MNLTVENVQGTTEVFDQISNTMRKATVNIPKLKISTVDGDPTKTTFEPILIDNKYYDVVFDMSN